MRTSLSPEWGKKKIIEAHFHEEKRERIQTYTKCMCSAPKSKQTNLLQVGPKRMYRCPVLKEGGHPILHISLIQSLMKKINTLKSLMKIYLRVVTILKNAAYVVLFLSSSSKSVKINLHVYNLVTGSFQPVSISIQPVSEL